jgi:hypothetical protein
MSVVFGIQEPRPIYDRHRAKHISRDFSSAQRYGPVHFILDQDDNPSEAPGPCLNKMIRGLKDFTEEDFVVYSGGDPLGLWLACAALNHLGFPKIQFLKWERERNLEGQRLKGSGYYTPVTLRTRP